MKSYKLSAIGNWLSKKKIAHKLPSSSDPYILLSIGRNPIYASVANSPESLQKGLMGVSHLDENQGCLLDFGADTSVQLWMKNCKINLQAAMINSEGTIVDILNMSKDDPYRIHYACSPVRYALEMNDEFFTKKKIKVGDKVCF
jgi:uncharacterized membrane protein (UPF0127 family)